LAQKKVKKEINIEQFVELRLAHKDDLVKILGRGKLESPIKITAHKFSASAKAAIEAAGGEAVTV
jgi:large subunit ribosomal protein L15